MSIFLEMTPVLEYFCQREKTPFIPSKQSERPKQREGRMFRNSYMDSGKIKFHVSVASILAYSHLG